MAYLVNQGRRELGIRLALGATPTGMAGLIVRRAVAVAGWGIGIGVAASWVVTRFMRGLLFHIQPTDPVTLLAIPVLLTLVAVVAAWTPARRAARIDPLESLRAE